MVISHPKLSKDLEHAHLFLDTNVFSTAFRNIELANLLVDLRENGCALTTIPSVLFEVTRGSSSLEIYNQRAEGVDSLVDYIDPMRWANDNLDEFSVVMAKLVSVDKSQYTDFLLAACLVKFQGSRALLMTADLNSMPASIFDRIHIITADNGKEVRTFGIYQLNPTNYGKVQLSLTKSQTR
jgi:hypothetical protein